MILRIKKLTPGRIALAVACICMLVYLPSLTCGFVNFDDPEYVLNNSAIRQLNGDFFASVFTQVHIVWWMPLTWISLALDYHFWGLNPLGYHLTNILLHAVNAGLVVFIADRLLTGMGRGNSSQTGSYTYPATLLLAGLLWGIHPLRVESVTWVTERKDVLNGLFTLGSLLFYLCYARKKGRGEAAGRDYCFSLVLFGLSLMAKSVSVVLPLMLLVADWYPFGRLRRGSILPLLVEKIPFFAMSAAMTVVTFYLTSRSNYRVSFEYFPLSQRIAVSGNALFEYLRLLLVPVGISPLHLIAEPIPFRYTVTTIISAGICVGVYTLRKQRLIPALWLCFLLPLLPVLAFFQNGDQAFASRFTYLPSVAPSIAAAALIAGGYTKLTAAGNRYARILVALCAAGLLIYATMTVRLIGFWKDTATFWTRAIDLEPSAIFYKERGKFYYSQGNHDAAVADYTAAIKGATGYLRVNVFNLYILRGEAFHAAGRFAEAVDDYTAAIGMYPHPAYYRVRGLALKSLGKMREAEEDFSRAGDHSGAIDWYEKSP
ncbi:MAG: hypothetical protein A2076_02840 [Geobacteraceae bacterium GWC2_53_11]|nr:MAG: hypothetical protein A2076_02840 [Geobacteraceae bacterium GWC2_53_11]